MAIPESQAEAVRRRLQQRARRPPELLRGKMDVIRQNYDTIVELQQKGYMLDHIARDIGEAGGFTITVNTLKNYLHRIRAERSETQPRPSRGTERTAGNGQAAAEGRVRAATAPREPEGSDEKAVGEAPRGRFDLRPDRSDL